MNNEMPKVRRTIYTVVVKRILDVVLSGTAIIVLSPVMIVITIFELVFHGRPVLFSQIRPGLHGENFRLFKFRSMTNEKDDCGNLLPGEKRLTSFGRFIRRFSLDELPELFCIFLGKMSIIGPRPLLVEYLPMYSPRHKMRHEVRPGLACMSLIPIKTWTWYDQLENDIWYIENCSFLVDVKMLFVIIKQALKASEYRVNDTREDFVDENQEKENSAN